MAIITNTTYFTSTKNSDENSKCPDIKMTKSLFPSRVFRGDRITYTINIYNYSCEKVKNAILSDELNPILKDISVSLNGNIISNKNYSYYNGLLIFPSEFSHIKLCLPPAEYTKNCSCGKITVEPSITTITICGTI